MLPLDRPRPTRPTTRPTLRLGRPAGAALAGLVVLMLGAAACSSSSKSATAPDTAAPTSAVPTTAAQPVPPATPISIPTSTDSTSPDGSGCTPPAGDTLPDGIWFGVLKSVNTSTSAIGLDLACWYTGTAAQSASGSATPVDNDYYVRNENPKVYALATATKVAVVPLATSGAGFTGGSAPATTGLAGAQVILDSQTPRYVWVEITHGLVTVIQAQFTP